MNQNHELRYRLFTAALLIAALTVTPLLAAAGGPMPGAGDEIDRLVNALEGGWVGNDNDTPFGKMGFATLFEWQEDGSLSSFSPLNSETYINLRFARDESGRWMLHEEAAMEGLGVQKYSLAPTATPTDEGLRRWVWEEDPDYLAIDVGVEARTMVMNVTLLGRPHIAFRLDKRPRESWAEMKRDMLARAELSPDEGLSILEVVSSPPASLGALAKTDTGTDTEPADPIDAAREAVAAAPESAEARVALAMQLRAAISENPANGPRYAFEMLDSLKTAIELDPRQSAAYHGLVGYYLNAPPIAGGSVEKAEETARLLAEFDPEGGNVLLDQIAARGGR